MVSAELAVALPAVVFVLLVSMNALMIGVDQVRCADAARVAARSAARGDPSATVRSLGQRAGPGGAQVTQQIDGDLVRVTVSSPVPGPFGWVAGVGTLRSTGVAQLEGTAETAADP